MNFILDFILNTDFKYIVAFIILAISIFLGVMKMREVEHEDDKREVEHEDYKREHEDEVEHEDDKREVDQIRNSSTYEHNSITYGPSNV